jgi:hypothetical protein
MGLWKVALGILIGVAITKVGRETLVDLGKLALEKGQLIADESSSVFNQLQTNTDEFVKSLKCDKHVDSAELDSPVSG